MAGKLCPVGTLHSHTIELVRSNKDKTLDIYRVTGVRPDWLRKFAAGHIPDPSVNKVQAVYEYLSGGKLI